MQLGRNLSSCLLDIILLFKLCLLMVQTYRFYGSISLSGMGCLGFWGNVGLWTEAFFRHSVVATQTGTVGSDVSAADLLVVNLEKRFLLTF